MMLRTAVVTFAVACALVGTARAADQTPPPPPAAPQPAVPQPPQPPQPVVQPGARVPPPPPPSPPQDTGRGRPRSARDVNVQVEFTISDQAGTSPAEKKVVSLIAADQSTGRVRANADARKENVGIIGTTLNVDARPTVLEGDRILLELTMEYTPLRETQVTQRPTVLNESLSVVLQSGKPLVISQAADPVSDRRMTVEVKATILK